jgi:hypothetical protein
MFTDVRWVGFHPLLNFTMIAAHQQNSIEFKEAESSRGIVVGLHVSAATKFHLVFASDDLDTML